MIRKEGFIAIGGFRVGKISKIIFILPAIVLSFYRLSFGGQLAEGAPPANTPNELIYGPSILHRESPFSSPEKAGFGSTRYIAGPSKAVRNRGFSMNPEVSSAVKSVATPKIQKKDVPIFENNELSMGNSSFHFDKINLIKTKLEPFLDFISSLSLAHYKKENSLSKTMEKFNENAILKPLAIFLEFELNF